MILSLKSFFPFFSLSLSLSISLSSKCHKAAYNLKSIFKSDLLATGSKQLLLSNNTWAVTVTFAWMWAVPTSSSSCTMSGMVLVSNQWVPW
jgi:hypothetical protein